MTQINSFAGSVVQSTQVQRQQAALKDRQVRREHELAKNVALQDDQLEHQVESSEALTPVHDQRNAAQERKNNNDHPRKQKQDQDEQPTSRLDLTA